MVKPTICLLTIFFLAFQVGSRSISGTRRKLENLKKLLQIELGQVVSNETFPPPEIIIDDYVRDEVVSNETTRPEQTKSDPKSELKQAIHQLLDILDDLESNEESSEESELDSSRWTLKEALEHAMDALDIVLLKLNQEMGDQNGGGGEGGGKRTEVSDVCQLSQDSGMCWDYIPKYGFNSQTHQCEEFGYTGCGGNGNRFDTLAECQAACFLEEFW